MVIFLLVDNNIWKDRQEVGSLIHIIFEKILLDPTPSLEAKKSNKI